MTRIGVESPASHGHDPRSGSVTQGHRENWGKSMCTSVGEECSTLGYFQGSLECEVVIHNTAMKKFTNLFEMKINSGMSHLF